MKKIAITSQQLQPIKNKFSNMKRLDPLSDESRALTMYIEALTDETLELIVDEKINFLSGMAWLELHNRGIEYALSSL